jgi:Mrp family chromosome partitioning ATPase
MKRRDEASRLNTTPVSFELLRGKIEVEVVRPAVIAITSPTAEDGKEIVVRGLAESLVLAGYATLLIDACLGERKSSSRHERVGIEAASLKLLDEADSGELSLLDLSNAHLQKATNQRQIKSVFSSLRSKFDYVIIAAERGDATAFAAAVIDSVDVVLVTVRIGRRERAADRRLSAALERIGSRFLGIVAVARSAAIDGVMGSDAAPVRRILSPAQFGFEHQTFEIAEWPLPRNAN